MARRKKRKSYGLIIIGITLMLFSLSALFTSPLLASFPNDLPKKVEVNKPQFEYPAKISVERVINDILVIPVEVHGNSWPLTDEAALYMANYFRAPQLELLG